MRFSAPLEPLCTPASARGAAVILRATAQRAPYARRPTEAAQLYAYRAEAAPDTDTPMPRFVDTAVRVSLGHQCGARRACSPTERFHASASLMSQLRQVSRPRHAATSGAAERWGRMQATPSLSGAAALRGAVAGVLPCPFPSLVLFVPGSRTAAASGTGAVSSFATSRGVGHSTPSAQEAKEL